ncbi:sulfatase-like hydrolase/transferase [Tundrisphaera lichenicola]|uniref:sulfatase-like hydrolase/transferase n=1 Tax=Tundrisphaera lichenicola TaxID=2029860 RepID=UPI003EBBE3A3
MRDVRRRWAMGLVLSFALCTPAIATSPEPSKPPNIILIYADDLGWGDVGFNGRKEWATPNLDRLAAQGTVFRRFYTAAVTCAPSRAALLTGKSTIHCGVSRNNDDLPAGEVTLAEALKPQGYETALFGKWHRGAPSKGVNPHHPMDQGFDEFYGFTDAKHAWEQYPEELYEGRELKPASGYANDLFTDRAVDYLRRKKDSTFFLYLPYIATHFYIQAPPEEIERHKGKFPEDDPAQPLNATYAAMVTRLDRNIGRVLDTLGELKLDERTIVIFTSDHGATFESGNQGTSYALDSNHPFRGQKRTLWEGGIRVPGVVRWSGHVPAGKVSDEIIQMTDLFPTLLAAAGTVPDPSWHVDGIDVLPTLLGRGPAPERTLFWEWRSEGSFQLAAMRGRFKLMIVDGGSPEMYDVEADPGELRNAIAQQAELAGQLRSELKEWLKTEIRDGAVSPSPRPID